jgi:hypothetical protein
MYTATSDGSLAANSITVFSPAFRAVGGFAKPGSAFDTRPRQARKRRPTPINANRDIRFSCRAVTILGILVQVHSARKHAADALVAQPYRRED